MLLVIGFAMPGVASPLPGIPSAISFTWSIPLTTLFPVTFQATGNASFDAGSRTLLLPVTAVSPPDAPTPPAGRTLVRTFGSGTEITVPSSLTGASPLVFTLTEWIFNYDNNTAIGDNLITAVVTGVPGFTGRQRLFNFAPLASVPGVQAVTFHPDTLSFINDRITDTPNGLPQNFNVAGFSLVPVPASMVLFATFGLALAAAASLRRREPMRLAA
jgi:hypothetical protein